MSNPDRVSSLPQRSRSVVPPEELQRFLDTGLYDESVFFVDELTRVDPAAYIIEGLFDTDRPLPFASAQRVTEQHPAHVSAAEILMATGALGCLHAWLFHGCRWDDGWVGFGNRIHRADWKHLAQIGPPIVLRSEETRRRVGPARVVLRYRFEFQQEGEVVYVGDQSAIFVKGKGLA